MSLVADGPLIQVCGRSGSSRATASGTSAHDLVGPDHAHVTVGHQGEGAATLTRTVVEHDGAGLGDADGGLGHHGVDLVELERGQACVDGGAGHVHPQPLGYDDDTALDGGRDPCGQLLRRAPLDDRPVVGDPLGEEVEQRGAGGRVGGAHRGAAPGPTRHRGRGADPGQDLLAGAHVVPPRVRFHQARNDSRGPVGRSRAPVHAAASGSVPAARVPRRANRSAKPSRRPEAKTVAAPFIATSVADGTPPRCASTTWARRSTRTDGMSILTGHTS